MRSAAKGNVNLLSNPIPQAERKMVSKFQHLVFYVKNIAATEAFYKRVFRLNFSAANNPNTSALQRIAGQSMSFYSFGHYHHDLAFCENKDLKPQTDDILHYAVQLKEGKTVDSLIVSLEQEGVRYRRGRLLQSARTPEGYQAVCLQDPDGRWIEVIGK